MPRHLPPEEVLYRSAVCEVGRQRALFSLGTVGRFLVVPGEATTVEASPGSTENDIDCMLRGPVAALRSCMTGLFCLRGAAVVIAGRSVALCAAGLGASTLAAALALRGHRLVADGVVTVALKDAGFELGAAPEAGPRPSVTLWPDSATALGLAGSDGAEVRPGLASRRFWLGTGSVVAAGAPRSCGVVALTVDGRLGPEPPLVRADKLQASKRISVLTEHEWFPTLPAALGLAGEHFDWATTIASKVPFVLVNRDPGPPRRGLGELVALLEEMSP